MTAVYRPGLPPVLRGLTFTIPVSGLGAQALGALAWSGWQWEDWRCQLSYR